jgi:hypothetical protein
MLFGHCLVAQNSTPYSIQPAEVLIGVRQSQEFQLLDTNGQAIHVSDWALSDPSLAEIKSENGRVKVSTKGIGHVFLTAGVAKAELDIRDSTPEMQLSEPRWILHPTDGQFTRVLWSWNKVVGFAEDHEGSVDLHFPAFFYEDRGTESSHVRAIRDDGVEAWRWPHDATGGQPRLICGDTYGGVLLSVGDPQSPMLINLDAKARERWRVSAPGFHGAMAYNTSGGMFIMEDDPDRTSVRLVGLDSKTGQQTMSYELPRSRETIRNLVLSGGKFKCSPNKETIKALPIFHTILIVDPNSRLNLMYSEASIVVDGGKCQPGADVDLRNVHVTAVQRLVAADVNPEGSVTTQTIEENRADGPAASSPIVSTLPTGDLIVGDGDTGEGNFVAVRRTTSFWGSKAPARSEGFEYRISSTRQVLYRMPVIGPTEAAHVITLLGSNRIGFTSRGKFVIAFDQDTGREKWRWQANSGLVVLHGALVGGMVLVRDGQEYYALKEGKVQEKYDDDFMLFRMRLRNADDDAE